MATKKVPATLDEIADAIDSCLTCLRNTTDPRTKIFFEEGLREGIEKKWWLFYTTLSDVKHMGIECTEEELLQGITLLRQRGKLPTN